MARRTIVVVAMLLLLASCMRSASKTEIYLNFIRSEGVTASRVNDEAALAIGRRACDAARDRQANGTDPASIEADVIRTAVFDARQTSGFDKTDVENVREMNVAAFVSLCPT